MANFMIEGDPGSQLMEGNPGKPSEDHVLTTMSHIPCVDLGYCCIVSNTSHNWQQ